MPESKTVRFGVVGSSLITDTMIAGASRYDDLMLTAVCSRTPQRAAAYAAKHQAAHAFHSIQDMASSDAIDMVYIASPNRLHMEQAEVFLQHGKHVLCEKPLTAYPQELERVTALADRQHCLFAEAIMMLFQPQLALLTDAIKKIGRLSGARFDFTQYSTQYPAYLAGKTPNIFNPALETGALQDLGIYCVYPALYLFGKPMDIRATATFLRTGADAAGAALLKYDDRQVTLTYSKVAQAAAPSEIYGDEGTITIGSISRLENMTLHRYDAPPCPIWDGEEKPVQMGREIHTFADWIRDGAGERYARHRQLAREVSACLYEIRRLAGIRFPRDNV